MCSLQHRAWPPTSISSVEVRIVSYGLEAGLGVALARSETGETKIPPEIRRHPILVLVGAKM